MSEKGYNHQLVGQKVAQLQAVLARRCASIGELQQHLLRAGWQQGVAQWGVLGRGGGEWAAVAGFGSSMPEESSRQMKVSTKAEVKPLPASLNTQTRRLSGEIGDVELEDPLSDMPSDFRCSNIRSSYKASVFVHKGHGGGLFVDDPGFLAEWSVRAVALIRRHLYRAGNGMVLLPYESNWRGAEQEKDEEERGTLISSPEPTVLSRIPTWATEVLVSSARSTADGSFVSKTPRNQITISNLPLLAAEIEALLETMEDVMAAQRHRRLDRLRPAGWLRRNWYIVASTVPATASLLLWIVRHGKGKLLVRSVYYRVTSFFKERLRDPVVAM